MITESDLNYWLLVLKTLKEKHNIQDNLINNFLNNENSNANYHKFYSELNNKRSPLITFLLQLVVLLKKTVKYNSKYIT